jgi:adenylate cyclase
VSPASALPAPAPAELRVLERIHAAPGIRLGCQLRPAAAVTVAPLLDPGLPPRALLGFRAPQMLGEERVVAILFADIRGFTQLSEHRLPFDVVDLLNRYFRAMGEAVEAAGGRVDKFIGDGVMALFGAAPRPADTPRDEAADARAAARAAIDGARRMAAALAALNRGLATELGEPLRIGIGIHLGPVILGAMGHGRTVTATAIGDAVNTASRLESASKDLRCLLVVSEAVLAAAGVAADAMPGTAHEVAVRGRSQPLRVRAIARGDDLPGGNT